MAKDFQLIHITVDEARLKGASNRLRNPVQTQIDPGR